MVRKGVKLIINEQINLWPLKATFVFDPLIKNTFKTVVNEFPLVVTSIHIDTCNIDKVSYMYICFCVSHSTLKKLTSDFSIYTN